MLYCRNLLGQLGGPRCTDQQPRSMQMYGRGGTQLQERLLLIVFLLDFRQSFLSRRAQDFTCLTHKLLYTVTQSPCKIKT
jgi:hypothetical protein